MHRSARAASFLGQLQLQDLAPDTWSGPVKLKKILYFLGAEKEILKLRSARFQAGIEELCKLGIVVGSNDYSPKLYSSLAHSPGIDAFVKLKITTNSAKNSKSKIFKIIDELELDIRKIKEKIYLLKREFHSSDDEEANELSLTGYVHHGDDDEDPPWIENKLDVTSFHIKRSDDTDNERDTGLDLDFD